MSVIDHVPRRFTGGGVGALGPSLSLGIAPQSRLGEPFFTNVAGFPLSATRGCRTLAPLPAFAAFHRLLHAQRDSLVAAPGNIRHSLDADKSWRPCGERECIPMSAGAKGAPATTATVSGADWSDQEITDQQHTRTAFTDLDLTEARLRGVVFSECTFRSAKFNCSTHADVAFVNCRFMNCSFFETQFADCKFVGSSFDRCSHVLMHVDGGNWSHCALPGADLRKARFSSVKLREADLTGANCEGASIRDCDLTSAWLGGARLASCDLRGSDLSGIELDPSAMQGTIITYQQAIALVSALGLDVEPE
jgi:fluoroquinolone resistance protein